MTLYWVRFNDGTVMSNLGFEELGVAYKTPGKVAVAWGSSR